MSLDTKIRENLDGKYITIYSDSFKEGIEYASKMQINQVQVIGVSEVEVDFKEFEKLGGFLKILSFVGLTDNIKNFDSIYLLQKIEKFYFQQKQKFQIDISKYPNIQHLGSEYWTGLRNIDKTNSLNSIVLSKLPAARSLPTLRHLKPAFVEKLQLLIFYL